MSKHKPTGKGPTYGEFNFAKGGSVWVKGYVRGGKVSQPKVEKVMHEFGEGKLHSGSKSGPVVTNRKQGIAIALSEGRKAVKKAEGGMIKPTASNMPNLPKPVMPPEAKIISGGKKPKTPKQQMAFQEVAKKGAAAKKMDASVPKFASGGLAGRIASKTKPTAAGLPPRQMNAKSRFVPKMSDGGKVHDDAKQDKVMIKKAIRQHDKNMHGGKTEKIVLKKGGKISK